MITVRKIKLTIIGDTNIRNLQYKWIRDEQYNQYRALNMGMGYLMTHHFLQNNESSLELRKQKEIVDIKNKITKINDQIEKEQNKKNVNEEKVSKFAIELDELQKRLLICDQNLIEIEKYRSDIDYKFKEMYVDDLYNVLSKVPFQHGDNKSLVSQRLKKDYNSDFKEIIMGKRSCRNYKREFPLMTRGRDLKFVYDDEDILINWIEGIKFKCILGTKIKNSVELRHTLHKIINNDYQTCDSSLQFDKNNNLILNLTLDIPVEVLNEKITGRVVGVDLGLKIPAYCALNDIDYIKRALGSIDDFLKVRTQMQSRRRDLQRSIKSATGGNGRDKKLQALDRFKEKEKNFAKTYNHFLSSNIVKFAVDNKAEQINLELLAMKETQDKSILRNWSYYQLQQFIEYKAEKEGIKVKYIDPYHTSQRCSQCGHHEEGQRESQSVFKCKACGYEANADYNAARNIAISENILVVKNKASIFKNLLIILNK